MYWNSLERKIKKECKLKKKDNDYINSYLMFAKNLFDKGLPLIATPQQLSDLIGLEHSYVCSMAYVQKKFYRRFLIKKKNGSNREIYEPLPDLKFVQHWILTNILEKCSVSLYAKAFIKNRDLRQNARFHVNQNVVVTMDIKDFFPSITVFDVYSIFNKMGYLKNVAWFLANLCCYERILPQGAPTSPYLSNLRLIDLDKRIANYTLSQKIRYTRYADDLTFSGNFDPHHLICDISTYVFKTGFRINSDKTRVAFRNVRQEVTGIVVNEKMQVSRDVRREIRKEIYYIKKYGINSHLKHIGEKRKSYINHLLGKINFALFVRPSDQQLREYSNYIKSMLLC